MSLEQHFTDSIEFRAHLDSQFSITKATCKQLVTEYRKTRKRAMQEPYFSLRQRICTLARTFSEQNNVGSYSYQCLADSHIFLQACLDQNLVRQHYMALTIGDVSYRGQLLFDTSRITIHEALDNGISTMDKPRFHAWLTLGDMTIIDFTINEHLASLGLSDTTVDERTQPSVWRHERRGHLDYHPILVDDDFLVRLRRPPQ